MGRLSFILVRLGIRGPLVREPRGPIVRLVEHVPGFCEALEVLQHTGLNNTFVRPFSAYSAFHR